MTMDGAFDGMEDSEDVREGRTEEMRRFLELTRIPRTSGHTEKMQEHLISFADSHGFGWSRDAVGNVLVRRPGKGPRIMLQAHQDIVPAVRDGYDVDMLTDPPEAVVEDGVVHALCTTLGADDGAGVALALCALCEPSLKDVDLSCLFTVDEETTMLGASAVSAEWMDVDFLINLDEEEDDAITMGCAGAFKAHASVSPEPAVPEGVWFEMEVSGVTGGHSGICIGDGGANAILVAASVLSRANVQISSLKGGRVPNAIPETAVAVFGNADRFDFDSAARDVLEEYAGTDPHMRIIFRIVERPKECWSYEDSSSILNALLSIPNGVVRRADIGVVSSSNLGVADTREGVLAVDAMARSAAEADLGSMRADMLGVLGSAGFAVDAGGLTSPWLEEEGSRLLSVSAQAYRDLFGSEPRVRAIHAGLECGILKKTNPGIEAISIGPTVVGVHTVSEHMSLESFSKAKRFLYTLLGRLSAA